MNLPGSRSSARWSPQLAGGFALIVMTATPQPSAQTLVATPDRAAPVITAVQRDRAVRLKLPVRTQRELNFSEPVSAVSVLEPEILTAAVTGERTLMISALATGDSLVIVQTPGGRIVLVIEVFGQPVITPEALAREIARRPGPNAAAVSGAYTISYTPPSGDHPAFFRHQVEYRHKLARQRTLRVAGDLFNFGRRQSLAERALAPGFGFNHLAVGADSPQGALDVMDSEISLTPLTLNGYLLRGLHLVSAPHTRLRGTELFAGIARPAPTLFGENEGRLFGMMTPVARGESWRVRVGMIVIQPQPRQTGNQTAERGGVLWQADVRYARDDTLVEGEVALSGGALSWRGQAGSRRGAFTFSGEALQLSDRSPLVSIGAQPGARQLQSAALLWQPSARFSASVNWHHAVTAPPPGLKRAAWGSAALLSSVSYHLNRQAQLSVQFAQQHVTAGLAGAAPLALRTRTWGVRHSQRFGTRLSHDFDLRFVGSRETNAGAPWTNGLSVREELRRSWGPLTASAYASYTRDTPSLFSLIARLPTLLPPALRAAYQADPVRFLATNGPALFAQLGGLRLPATRNLSAGVRAQGQSARLDFTGEAFYSDGALAAHRRRDVFGLLSANYRLDAANSVSVSGARSLSVGPGRNFSLLTFSWRHRFGGGAGEGFQFPHFFGLDHGQLVGRVFLDLNGNGADDAAEPGLPDARIQLDGGATTQTNESGRFSFGGQEPGEHTLRLLSDELGLGLRATTATEQPINLTARQKARVDFGVSNFGFLSGIVYNDLYLAGAVKTEKEVAQVPGISGVRLRLRPVGQEAGQTELIAVTSNSGLYSIRNLLPGQYLLEIVPETIPPGFRLPDQATRPVRILPLQGIYVDVALAAQRTVSGVVFVDRNGDRQFDPQADEPVKGARVTAGQVETLTDERGVYLLRGLPAGTITLRAVSSEGNASRDTTLEFGPEPETRRAVNLLIEEQAGRTPIYSGLQLSVQLFRSPGSAERLECGENSPLFVLSKPKRCQATALQTLCASVN